MAVVNVEWQNQLALIWQKVHFAKEDAVERD